MSPRRIIVIATVTLVVMSLLASPVGAAAGTSTLRVGLHTDEGTLTPYSFQRGDPGYNLLLLVYDTLLLLDADAQPQPGLAQSHTWSADGKVLTLELRKGVKWHDGKPFTAEDVVFTFKYVQANASSRFTGPVNIVEKIEATGTHRVVITLKQVSAGFIYQPLADLPILPKHIWDGVTTPKTFPAKIGTGPYKLVEYKADQYYRFEANKDYYMGAPSVDKLVMPIIKDSTALFAALKAGEIDAASRPLSPELVADFTRMSQMKVVRGPGTVSILLAMNNQIAPFDNKEFRRAISLAINKKDLLNTLFLGYAIEGSPGWLHPAMSWYLKELDGAPRYDPAQAKRILEELGYRDVNGDGFREKPDGSPMQFTMHAPSDEPIRVRAAEITASDYLKAVGLKVKVIVLERSTLFANNLGWSGTAFSGVKKYDLLMWGWAGSVQSWPGYMRSLFYSSYALGNLNIQGSKSATLDPILDAVHLATDPAKMADLANQAQRIIAADTPVVSLGHPDGIYVYNQNVYAGWVLQKGSSIVNKLSFVAGTARAQAKAQQKAVFKVGLIVLAAAAVAIALLIGRRRRQAGKR
jgi:peptide/nickel transport system substrate-binding protein